MIYLKENQSIQKLRRYNLSANQKKNFKFDSLFHLINFKLVNTVKGIFHYMWEVFFGFNDLIKLFKYKNISKNQKALVLGNGPSQEYISKKDLIDFKKKGSLFFVNYWFLNKKLQNVIPNFLVISDLRLVSNNNDPFFNNKNKTLIKMIKKNKTMNIICPIRVKYKLKNIINEERIIAFCDSELRGVISNTWPIFPRGYLSMTVYKALALANWMNFKKIYILGVDNTYPRNTYSDINNSILNHEIHAGKKFKDTTVVNNSLSYNTMADLFQELSILFRDAKKFNKKNNIYNLDQYSLTDTFKKIKFSRKIFKEI